MVRALRFSPIPIIAYFALSSRMVSERMPHTFSYESEVMTSFGHLTESRIPFLVSFITAFFTATAAARLSIGIFSIASLVFTTMLIITESSVFIHLRSFLPLPSVCSPATCTLKCICSLLCLTARMATELVESTQSYV